MLLKNILNGTLNKEIILIKDDALTSGLHVLNEILLSYISRKCGIHYFVYERSKCDLLENVSDIMLYDCFSTNCPWFNENVQCKTFSSEVSLLLKESHLNQQLSVIDSVSHVLMADGINKLSKTLSKLSSVRFKSGVPVFPVILVLHDFDEDNLEHRQLEYISNIILTLSSHLHEEKIKLFVERKKSSGKLVSEKYSCWLDPASGKFNYEIIKEQVVKPPEPGEPNFAELTTFKLTLEDKEIQSRNKLVLPYMRRQEEKGKIFYEPDANDDWDDEDPDDDLEI